MSRKINASPTERHVGQAPDVSARDLDTMRRIVRKIGHARAHELVESVPIAKDDAAPRQERVRQCVFAVLYEMKCFHKRTSRNAFAEEISSVVQIKYGRLRKAGGIVWKVNNSSTAIKQDLHRGWNEWDEKLAAEMVKGFVWWRYTSVNPEWGFLIGGTSPNVSIEPKNPCLLIQWIDAVIDASGARAAIEQRFAENNWRNK